MSSNPLHGLLWGWSKTRSRCFAATLVAITLATNGMAEEAKSSQKEEAGDRQKAATAVLAVAGQAVQKCFYELNGVPKNAQLERVLWDIDLKIRTGIPEDLNPAALLGAINKAAGKPMAFSAGELMVCLEAYRAQTVSNHQNPIGALKLADQAYPSCPGEISCPNPTEPGGQCCSTDQVCASECGPEGDDCYALCESSCFPGDGQVVLEDGTTRPMTEVEVGDRVQVVETDGTIGFEDVYLMAHKDKALTLTYLDLELSTGKVLTLSPRHFIPVTKEEAGSWDDRVVVAANEVAIGDTIWFEQDNHIQPRKVTRIAPRQGIGAFNPMTASGTIIVNGVVASAHSDWFLDGMISPDAQARVYQGILAPARGAYLVLGPRNMQMAMEESGIVDLARERPFVALLTLCVMLVLSIFCARQLWRFAASRVTALRLSTRQGSTFATWTQRSSKRRFKPAILHHK